MGAGAAKVEELWEADPQRRRRVEALAERFAGGWRLFEPGRIPGWRCGRILGCRGCRAFVTVPAGFGPVPGWLQVREIRWGPSGRFTRRCWFCPWCVQRMRRIA